tara:strand:- start:523 stop:1371 length:849 start_codon:yes stop_codon:yes gene_type:complete
MVELDIEHVLILVIVVFMLYHLSSCRCSNNGFRVEGASNCNLLKVKNGCKDNRKCVGQDFNNCDVRGANLEGADLTEANLSGADLTNASLTNASLSRASLTDANCSGANLTGADLTYADLTGAITSTTHLMNADLTSASLTDADLTNADLRDANLEFANLTGANLSRANLTDANLSYANLFRANLEDADLTGANLSHVINPLGAKCSNGRIRGEGLTIFPNNSPYTCSSNNLWKYKDCSNALETICPSSIFTNSRCFLCAGKHQPELMTAGCTNDDFKNYCK